MMPLAMAVCSYKEPRHIDQHFSTTLMFPERRVNFSVVFPLAKQMSQIIDFLSKGGNDLLFFVCLSLFHHHFFTIKTLIRRSSQNIDLRKR